MSYLNVARAAEFCGVSVSTFRLWRTKFNIQAAGPMAKCFSINTLDEFMKTPGKYLKRKVKKHLDSDGSSWNVPTHGIQGKKQMGGRVQG